MRQSNRHPSQQSSFKFNTYARSQVTNRGDDRGGHAEAQRAAAKLQQQPGSETTRATCYGGGLGLRQTKLIW